MKGITHFTVGVAAAACFPACVRAGAEGNALYFILGGVFGLLPDTLDFKFLRFLYRHDIEVMPDPLRTDPQMLADALALAANRAFRTRRPVRIKLNSVPLGLNRWRRYDIRFDPPGRRVVVRSGPAVNLSGTPAGPEAEPAREAEAALDGELRLDYQAALQLDGWDGPVFSMDPEPDGRVAARFIPWHRAASHSLLLGVVCGLLGALLWDWLAGAVILAAYTAHTLADQLGFMGSNLWFPFRSRRTEGLKRAHSGDAEWNFGIVWVACLLIFWSLYRQTPGRIPGLNLLNFFFYGAVLPGVLALLLRRRLRRRAPKGTAR